MDSNEVPAFSPGPPPQDGGGGKKKVLGPFAVIGAILLKFKGGLIVAFKFLPILVKTGGSMIVSIWIYSMMFGWMFAVGFVVLIFIHECGHLLMAKRLGLKVGAPMFIPFVGAIILLKEQPQNAWIEAQVAIGGPVFGTVGAILCYGLYMITGNLMFCALASTGFWLNLFNLAPLGFVDGGRIVTAISPWLWLVGTAVMIGLLFWHFNIIVVVILIASTPRLLSLFRKRTDVEARYFEVTPAQRWIIGGAYFGLILFLMAAMFTAKSALATAIVE